MLCRCPGCKVGLCCTGTWICFPRGRSSPCCSGMSQSSFWLQSSDLSPFYSFSVSGVNLGTKSCCKEWMQCCNPVSIPHCSLVTPLALTTRTEPGRITIASAYGTKLHGTGPLEFCLSPRLFLHAAAVRACRGARHQGQLPRQSSGACCAPGEIPAALGSAQPEHRRLLLGYAGMGPWAPAIC